MQNLNIYETAKNALDDFMNWNGLV